MELGTHHAGIILAAGASSRMGRPKALLPMPDGQPLAVLQYRLLEQAGYSPMVIVLGSEAESIRSHLKGCITALNPIWKQGRFTSVLAGIDAIGKADGYLFLPVDTAGVRTETLIRVRDQADRTHPTALRPVYQGKKGNILWISNAAAQSLKTIPAHENTRLDLLIGEKAVKFEVDDPAILNNVNSPEEWERVVSSSRFQVPG